MIRTKAFESKITRADSTISQDATPVKHHVAVRFVFHLSLLLNQSTFVRVFEKLFACNQTWTLCRVFAFMHETFDDLFGQGNVVEAKAAAFLAKVIPVERKKGRTRIQPGIDRAALPHVLKRYVDTMASIGKSTNLTPGELEKQLVDCSIMLRRSLLEELFLEKYFDVYFGHWSYIIRCFYCRLIVFGLLKADHALGKDDWYPSGLSIPNGLMHGDR